MRAESFDFLSDLEPIARESFRQLAQVARSCCAKPRLPEKYFVRSNDTGFNIVWRTLRYALAFGP